MKEGEALKNLCKTSKYTMQEIADKIGISRAKLYQLFEDDIIEDYYIVKFNAIGLDVHKNNKSLSSDEKPVPYYDIDASAGNVTIFETDGKEYIKQYINVPAFSDCQMFIGVSGNSMYPKYCSGELIALKKIQDFGVMAWNEAHLIVTKEQRLLKYLRKGKSKDHWLLVSENKEYEPIDIAVTKVLHLYQVKGKITKNVI